MNFSFKRWVAHMHRIFTISLIFAIIISYFPIRTVSADIPVLFIDNVSLTEGDSGTTLMTFTVNMSAATDLQVTVDYGTVPGTAEAGSDYFTTSETLTFLAGVTIQTIEIPIVGDLTLEPTETFQVQLSNPINATLDPAYTDGTGTIFDNDPVPDLSIADSSLSEGNTGTSNMTFTVTLSNPSAFQISVHYTTQNGSAQSPSDFQATSGTLTFAAGEITQAILVPIVGDLVNETDETFTVSLSSPVNAGITRDTAIGTITNDDVDPDLSIADSSLSEGNTGTSNMTFTVTMSNPSVFPISVHYTTQNGSAQSPSDYQATSGTLSFAAGEITQAILVPIVGDLVNETDETFTVHLSSPVNAIITRDTAIGTISNDDVVPNLSIADSSLNEGNTGTSNMTFTVTMSNPSAFPISVQYTTQGGSAQSPPDYQATSGTLSFAAGEITQTILVPIVGDLVNEPDETFTVHLSNPVNADITRDIATGTITNDDALPNLSIADSSLAEGNTGTSNMTFKVTLSNPSAFPISVQYTTQGGSAQSPSDYQATSGTLNFAAGEVTSAILVPIVGDLVNEPDETFTVHLSNPVNADITRDIATGTITNDDALPTLMISNPSPIIEGNSGTALLTFTVTLTGSTDQNVTVAYATAPGTAKAGSDYVNINGTLTFTPGITSQTIDISIVGDLTYEPTEIFQVQLSNPVNATLDQAHAAGTGTILDNDPVPDVSITDAALVEGDLGTSNMTFTVTLSNPSSSAISVQYTTQDGSAQALYDYQTTSGSLNFLAGETTKTILVPIVNDQVNEPTETFTVYLSSAVNANIIRNTATGTISDNDPLPSLAINDVSIIEALSGTSLMTFTVTLTGATEQIVTIEYFTQDGTAKSPNDYTSTNGILTFNPRTTTQTFTVSIVGDIISEPTQTFTVHLNAPTNASITKPDGTGTIIDLDPPGLSINDVSVTEGNVGTNLMNFTVTLIGLTELTVNVDYVTVPNTALATADYTPTGGTLTFAPGITTQTISVPIVGDLMNEPTETFLVRLSNPINSFILKSDGTGTIIDNDPLPTLSINNPASFTEGNSGATPMNFTVTLAGSTSQTVTVGYTTVPNTALATADYITTSGTLTFAPGINTQIIPVPIVGDLVNEPTETFLVRLSNPTNASISISDGTGTIIDNDQLPTLSINNPAPFTEGDSGTAAMTFTVALSGSSAQTVTVGFSTVPNTALASADYITTSGTLTFAPGTITQTISVPIVGDLVNEPTQTFQVQISNPTNATLVQSSGTGTINDNDPPPTIAFSQSSPYTVLENDPSGQATIMVNLSQASDYTVTVNYASSDGTAHQGVNYQATSGTLTFLPGVTIQLIVVPIINDFKNDPTLTLNLTISNPTNATLGTPNSAILAIFDQDSLPILSITDVSKNEGNTGIINFIFTVSLSSASGSPVTVDYTTQDGTAIAGSDYNATSGTLLFNLGVLTRTISIPVNSDNIHEPDETFTILLSNALNADIIVDTGTGTIQNDDSYLINLPMIAKPGGPDLTISSFTLTPAKTSFLAGEPVLVTVTIKNIGSADAGSFWLDFYINPQQPPTVSNTPWNTNCGLDPCMGIAWYVKAGLKAGRTLILTSTISSYAPDFTVWNGSLPSGTTDLYVYVDSWGGINNPLGAVVEINENNNRAEIHGLKVTTP